MSSGASTPSDRKTESPKEFVDKSDSSKQKLLSKVDSLKWIWITSIKKKLATK